MACRKVALPIHQRDSPVQPKPSKKGILHGFFADLAAFALFMPWRACDILLPRKCGAALGVALYRAYDKAMTTPPPLYHIKAAEDRLAQAVAGFVPELGLNRLSLNAGAKLAAFNDGERDLIAPNGASDIAAILWRAHDACLNSPETLAIVAGMKIRDKIGYLLTLRLDEGARDERLARRLMGFFALPQHAGLYHRLLWETAGTVWRLAGDKALDENHYSKRAIVSGILTTAMMTRLSQGRDAQQDQIARNIQSVMDFEKFKANVPFNPDSTLIDLAGRLGKLRFGHAESPAA